MANDVNVYILADPLDPTNYRYVGKTGMVLSRRLGMHISQARGKVDKTHRSKWIRKLLREERLPIMVHVHACLDQDAANTREIHYIALMKYVGYKLTNGTDGGEGATGYQHAKDAINKISARSKELWADPTHRENMKVALAGNTNGLGYKHTDEARAKISNANIGQRKALGSKRSEESKAAISARLMGNTYSLGFKHSDETKAKWKKLKNAQKITPDFARIMQSLRALGWTYNNIAHMFGVSIACAWSNINGRA